VSAIASSKASDVLFHVTGDGTYAHAVTIVSVDHERGEAIFYYHGYPPRKCYVHALNHLVSELPIGAVAHDRPTATWSEVAS